MIHARGFALAALVCCLATLTVSAQDYTLSASNASGLPGAAVSASVNLDSMTGGPLTAWSFGLCVDSTVATITSASAGATTVTINNGAAPEFESIDLYAGGVTHGVVICFVGCATLAPGVGYELLVVDYELATAVGTTDVCFCDTLGVPSVDTLVVDTVATAIVPAQVCGSVSVNDLAVPADLVCSVVAGTCTCDAVLNWTNPTSYDSIDLLRDGVFVETLAGTATSYTSAFEIGLHEYCLVPTVGAVIGSAVCCSADCPDLSVPTTPVSSLSCAVDAGCNVVLNWINTSDYESLVVTVDGVTSATLAGTDTTHSLTLTSAGTFNICVGGTTICGDAIADTCCSADCTIITDPFFLRGDMNGSGVHDIADVIALLDLLFSGGTAVDCADALDSNDGGSVDIADAIYMLDFLFSMGPVPADPFLTCGTDPTADSLDCVSHPACP